MNAEQKTLLNKLTPLQQRVALGLIAGKSSIDAYFEAGGTAASRQIAKGQVSRMRKTEKFTAFMGSTMEGKIDEAIMTRVKVLEKLSDVIRNSKNDHHVISAISKLSEMQGWYAPKKHMDIPAPPGVAKRYSQEDYEEAEQMINERFQ